MLERRKGRNDIHQGKWNGLGGKMERGETPEECVVREIKEESGLTLRSPVLKGILTFPGFDGENDWLVFVFLARHFSGKMRDSDEGRLHWIENRKLTRLPLWEGDKYFLKWLERRKFFSAKFVYKKGKLKNYQVSFP